MSLGYHPGMSDWWWLHPGARCVGMSKIMTELDGSNSVIELTKICTDSGGCPVWEKCLRSAVAEGDIHFARGGTTPRQRSKAIRAIRSGSHDELEHLVMTVQAMIARRRAAKPASILAEP
jgi:hypothetical protein